MSGAPDIVGIRERIVRAEGDLVALARREAGVALLRFETPEDLALGAIQEALRSADRLVWEGEAAFGGWMRTIARRYISGRRDHWFACRRNPGALLRLSVSGLGGERLARRELADSAAGPGTFAFRREQMVLAMRALEVLLPRDRQIVIWTTEGADAPDLAARLGISVDASEKARTRALERLRKAFLALERGLGGAGG